MGVVRPYGSHGRFGLPETVCMSNAWARECSCSPKGTILGRRCSQPWTNCLTISWQTETREETKCGQAWRKRSGRNHPDRPRAGVGRGSVRNRSHVSPGHYGPGGFDPDALTEDQEEAENP